MDRELGIKFGAAWSALPVKSSWTKDGLAARGRAIAMTSENKFETPS